eukprot:SAG22_NODE_196_length_15552_cov_971.604543_2_plen_907_part_00
MGAGAELEISAVTVAATSGLAFRIADSSTVMVTSLHLQKGDGSASAISCAALAIGVGQAGLTCAGTGFGGVNVAGPLFISTSGTGFGMGATKYMGEDRNVFEEAVSTREPGLYTCQISHDEIVTLTLPVESAMHVSIVGDDSMPQWSFTGEGPTFTVAVHAYLNLAYITVPGGQVSLMRGGEVSLDHVQMQQTQLHVAGSLAASNSQLTDVQLETESTAVMTMDSTSISGTGEEAMALPIGCSVTINGGEIRNAELQVTSDGELVLTGTAMYVEGMAVSAQSEGSFTVSSSQLIHGETTDPFPCNGANMACTGQHAGSVMVAGPASINTAAPLVCADESAGSCLSGYVDMPSCLADIERGMESCFVYLQRDTGELGTISVDAGEHFEIHGNQGEPKLRLLADWSVGGALVLADLQIVGGSGDGSQISVEAGGDLTFEHVQMEGGSLTFAGVVALMESSLVEATVTGSSGSELSLSGGTVAGSMVAMTSGEMTIVDGCALTNSPVSIIGAGSSVTISGAELQSDGSSVPLTIESGGTATVTETTFRTTAGDITVASISEGASLTVGASQLVGVDGSADPFPCDGTLPDCAGVHAGSVVVEGRAAITLASPLVCDLETGECLADVCLARGDVCVEAGSTWSSGSTCVDAVCVCVDGFSPAVVQWAAASDGTDLGVSLSDDAACTSGTPCEFDNCSPTIEIANAGQLTIDCGKPWADAAVLVADGLCRVLERLHVNDDVAADLVLRGLLFSGLSAGGGRGPPLGGGSGGAVHLGNADAGGASASVLSCAFIGNSAWFGGAIISDRALTVIGCRFESNNAVVPPDCPGCSPSSGGAISFGQTTGLTISATTFIANTAENGGPALRWDGHSPRFYTNDEANAAFGGGAGRRLLALSDSTSSLPIKSDDIFN